MENQPIEQLNKQERKQLKREQRVEEKQNSARWQTLKRGAKTALVSVLIAGGVGGFGWYLMSRPPVAEGEIISRNGLHWHPQLEIFIKGEKLEIPANIGIGAVHNPIHTHDSSGVLHLEFPGVVQREDLRLEKFFQVWNKDISEFGSSVGMTVNGKENAELGNYEMKDGDKIVLRYE